MLYLYDPRHNVTTETTTDEAAAISGVKKENLASYKSRGQKIGSIGCYLIDETVTLNQRRKWYAAVTYADEHWVPLYGGKTYSISNYGRIKKHYKNFDRFVLPIQHNSGMTIVKLTFTEDKKRESFPLAILVAEHFLGKRKPGAIVYHKNRIRWDNHAANLMYTTRTELGKKAGALSSSKPVVQYDPNTLEILEEYRSAREAGRRSFMSYQTVIDNCHGRTRSAYGIHFMYEKDFFEKYGNIGGGKHAG